MKSHTDIEQSKRLSEILPVESADFHFSANQSPKGYLEKPIWGNPEYADYNALPCWSLGELIEALPLEVETHKQTNGHKIYYYVESYMKRMKKEIYLSTELYENLVDACVEMIYQLKQRNLLQC